jgi:hypothetical protein
MHPAVCPGAVFPLQTLPPFRPVVLPSSSSRSSELDSDDSRPVHSQIRAICDPHHRQLSSRTLGFASRPTRLHLPSSSVRPRLSLATPWLRAISFISHKRSICSDAACSPPQRSVLSTPLEQLSHSMFHSTPTALLLLLAVVLPSLALPAPSMAPSPSASSKPKSFSADLNTTDSGSDYSPPVDMNSTTPQIIAFHTCLNSPSPAGVVNAVTVMPCERANGDEPCRFRYGVNYTIAINYTSYLGAENPKQTLEARDDTVVPSLRYPYSGQSFNACEVSLCFIFSTYDTAY